MDESIPPTIIQADRAQVVVDFDLGDTIAVSLDEYAVDGAHEAASVLSLDRARELRNALSVRIERLETMARAAGGRPIRVIVCGSRTWTSYEVIRRELAKLPPGSTVVHGAQGRYEETLRQFVGADAIAGEIARELGLVVEPHPADWKKFGHAAGPRRNAELVARGADAGLASGDLWDAQKGRPSGTGDCVIRMNAARILVRVIPWPMEQHVQGINAENAHDDRRRPHRHEE